jgi:hypothetical protein
VHEIDRSHIEDKTYQEWHERTKIAEQLEKTKFKNKETIMNNLVYDKVLWLETLNVLCSHYKVNLYYILGRTYVKMFQSDKPAWFMNEMNQFIDDLNLESYLEIPLDKPLKSVSYYKLAELQDMSQRLLLPIEKYKKQELYHSIKQVLIKCQTPTQISIVKDFIPANIMEMLDAGNITEAITKLNCNVDTNENIIEVLTKNIKREIHNKKLELEYQEKIIPTDTRTYEEILTKIRDKIKSLELKLESITLRVKNFTDDCCPICLCDFDNPVVVPCCNHLFCLYCLSKVKNKCPICRTIFNIKDMHIISNDVKNKINKDKQTKKLTKIEALIKILKEKTGKFLLFSNYDQTFNKLIDELVKNNIVFSRVQGSGAVVNKIIERFENNEIDVLLLNAQYYGSGLNLQMATDIIIYHEMSLELETQIIGRAQRIGRNKPLNVFYLLHDHESHNVTSPVLDISLDLDEDIDKLEIFCNKKKKHKKIITNSIDI